MSLKTKIKNAVDIAFDKLKDLSVTAEFENKEVSSFNFATGTIESNDSSYIAIGFLNTKQSYENDLYVTKTTLTIKNQDPTIDFNRYSQVTINNEKYNCKVISKDDFIVILNLMRI